MKKAPTPPPRAFLNSLLLPLALSRTGYETGTPVPFASLFADDSPVVVFSVAECTRGELRTAVAERTIGALRRSGAHVVLLIKPDDPERARQENRDRQFLSTRPEDFRVFGNAPSDVAALLRKIQSDAAIRAFVPTDDIERALEIDAVRWRDRRPPDKEGRREPRGTPTASAPRGLRNAVIWFRPPTSNEVNIQPVQRWLAPADEPCENPAFNALTAPR